MEGVRLFPELWELILEGLPFRTRYHVMLVCKEWHESLAKPGKVYIQRKLKRKREKEPFIRSKSLKGMETNRNRITLHGQAMVEMTSLCTSWEISITTLQGSIYVFSRMKHGLAPMEALFKSDRVNLKYWPALRDAIEIEEEGGVKNRVLVHDDIVHKGYFIKRLGTVYVPFIRAEATHLNEEIGPIHGILRTLKRMEF